ncbi:hypothetical protein JTB14_020978 [Gonioctena quinquepunctata]|nr:hypothetical protein JTB14_020978 [Gonioctena quinquepunctata]
METLFGWDLLYSSAEKDIKNNQDILVCLAHLVLISNGFKTIGLGESRNIDGNESKSEALPKNWNEHYALRYVYQGRLYNFKATLLEDGVMINLIRVDERSVSLVQLNTRSVAQRTGTLDEMIPDHKNIVDMIKKQLIDKVIVSKKLKEMSSQTDPVKVTSGGVCRADPMGIRPDLSGIPAPAIPFPEYPLGPDYGRSDLDPLGGMNPLRIPGRGGGRGMGGGGMLFQPPGPSFGGPPLHPGYPGVPPGAIPPGARFDPFRPPDVDRFHPRRPPNRPDNDELPPPGYDDMFM